jgi:hypothetical protein
MYNQSWNHRGQCSYILFMKIGLVRSGPQDFYRMAITWTRSSTPNSSLYMFRML